MKHYVLASIFITSVLAADDETFFLDRYAIWEESEQKETKEEELLTLPSGKGGGITPKEEEIAFEED